MIYSICCCHQVMYYFIRDFRTLLLGIFILFSIKDFRTILLGICDMSHNSLKSAQIAPIFGNSELHVDWVNVQQ